MLTTLYYSIVNNEIKMPGQLENKVVVELTPSQKHHIAVLQGVNAHIALLKEYRFSKVIFDDCRSSDVVSTLFRCVWLEFDIYLDNVLVKGHLRSLLLEKSLDTLRFCLITCWTLNMDLPEKSFIDILRRTTASLREIVGNESLNEVNRELDIVCDENMEVVTRMMHLNNLISYLKDYFSFAIDTIKMENKLELFKKDTVPPCEGRKYIYDQHLVKKTHKGVLKDYTVGEWATVTNSSSFSAIASFVQGRTGLGSMNLTSSCLWRSAVCRTSTSQSNRMLCL